MCASIVYAGLSDKPKPTWSGATARCVGAKACTKRRYRNDQVGLPCSIRTGSPPPSSTTCIAPIMYR